MSLLRYGEVVRILDRLPDTVEIATRMTGISQRELARRAGISSASITRLMHGRDITLSTAVAILRALDELGRTG